MKKIIGLCIAMMFVMGSLVDQTVHAAPAEPAAISEYRYYELIRNTNTQNPLVADEEVEIIVTFRLTNIHEKATLFTDNLEMGAASDFHPRTLSREMHVVEESINKTTRVVSASIRRIRYRGSGSLFEVYGTLTYKDEAGNEMAPIDIDESIVIAETGTIGEAPEPKLQPYIVKYEVSSNVINKGDVFSVVMEVVDPNYRYSDLVNKNFDSSIALLSDKNFNSSNMQGAISNIGSDAMGNLKYEVRFNNITYAGPESLLEFRVTYKADVLIDGKVYRTTSDKVLTRNIFETGSNGGSDAVYKPNILISNYTGTGGVVAGKRIDFKVTFKNTSDSVAVSNVIIGVNGGEAFAMAKGVNKIFVNSIEPQKEVSIDLSMIASKTAAPSSYPIQFEVTYNYLDGKTIQPGTMTSEIAIPITQQDRVRINYVKVQNAWMDSEVEVNYSILNTGLSSVKNAQIEVLDEANNSMAILFLGNIDAGKEAKGTNMYLMFHEAREYQLTMRLTYEDDNFNQKEIKEEFTVGVMGGGYFPPIDPEPFPPIEEEKPKNNTIWLFGGMGAAIMAAVGFVVWKRRKNKQGVIDDEDL